MEDLIKKVIYTLIVDAQDQTSGHLGSYLKRSQNPYGIFPQFPPSPNWDAFITYQVGDFVNDNSQNGQRGTVDWTFTVWNRKVTTQIEWTIQRIYRLLQDYNELATSSYVGNFRLIERGPLQFSEKRNSYYATITFRTKVHILAGNAEYNAILPVVTYFFNPNGFAEPLYTLGYIGGQDNWTNGAIISGDQYYSDSQSVNLTSTESTRYIDTSTAGFNGVTIEFYSFSTTGLSTRRWWMWSRKDENDDAITSFFFSMWGDRISFRTGSPASDVPLSNGIWNKIKVVIDFQGKDGTAWTGDCYVNDVKKFTGLQLYNNGSGGVGLWQIGIDSSDAGFYMDDLSIYTTD